MPTDLLTDLSQNPFGYFIAAYLLGTAVCGAIVVVWEPIRRRRRAHAR